MANDLASARQSYEQDGFILSPPLLSSELIESANFHMDAVLAGEYETGLEPFAAWKPGDDASKIRKIDQPHLADRTQCIEPLVE